MAEEDEFAGLPAEEDEFAGLPEEEEEYDDSEAGSDDERSGSGAEEVKEKPKGKKAKKAKKEKAKKRKKASYVDEEADEEVSYKPAPRRATREPA